MKGTQDTIFVWIGLWLLLGLVQVSNADVAPGDVIDKSSWQKAEGLLPESVLNWVKNGEYVVNVGSLNYDPSENFPDYAFENMEKNRGKYAVNEKDEMIDVQTGKIAEDIVGIPFPKIDPNDPKAATKIIYNSKVVRLLQGSGRWPGMLAHSLSRSRVQRTMEIHMKVSSFLGWPGTKDLPNPNHYQELVLYRVNSPYDLAGTAVLLWRYLGRKQDMTYAYVPAIRRVRRMSPANRSDAMFGSDFSTDDSGYAGYDGKVPFFTWRLVEEGEMLGMFYGADLVPCRPNEFGELAAETASHVLRFGFQREGWTAAAWTPTNVIYVRRPVWIIQCHANDPFYNFGKQLLWVDKETFCGYYKQIFDHSGENWKTWYQIWGATENDDKTFRVPLPISASIVDDRTRHATIFESWHPRSPSVYFTKDSLDVFSLAGFQRFCK